MNLTLLEFGAEWCMPCKQMPALLEKIKERFPRLTIEQIDISEREDLASKYRIQSVPALVLLDGDGDVIEYASGLNGVNMITDYLEDYA